MPKPLSACSLLAGVLLGALALPAQARDEKPHWGYTGKQGAQAWGDLEPGFATCKLGRLQSPIDIRRAEAKKAPLPTLGFAYAPGPAEVVNNGHSIQVNLPAGGTATLADGESTLQQFHFHTPSEEKIDGRAFPLVAHLVHRNAQGKLGVVAVLFKQGRKNTALQPVFARMPARAGQQRMLAAPLNPMDMLPADRGYYRFTGSLTTPPCSEEVAWHVLKQPVEISRAQLDAFRKLYRMNARPVQPLNGRTVEQS